MKCNVSLLLLCVIIGKYGVISFKEVSCKEHKFKCNNNQCIDDDLLCDGKADCSDNSDETFDACSTVTCPKFTYKCKYGACIHPKHRCNGIQDCIDNSDEESCKVAGSNSKTLLNHSTSKITAIKGKYICMSGEIIADDLLCDGEPNCSDGSDETPKLCSNILCPYFTYRCDYGACIRLTNKCNGIKNCVDGSDENECGSTSYSGLQTTTTSKPPRVTSFQCTSGEYINEEYLCDGEPDCADKSDETFKECSQFQCPSYSYKCQYGACVRAGARCNGIRECVDNSDESSCNVIALHGGVIKVKKFECGSGQTIEADMVCDGKADCADFTDESVNTCSHINCPRFAYKCNYGGCVHGTARCNGLKECFDNSDEAFCPTLDKPVTKLKEPYKDFLIFS